MPYIEGAKEYRNAGAPGNGTSSVWTLTIDESPSSGTFKLRFDGYTTAPITWSATTNTLLANILAALVALPSIGAGGVTVADVSLAAGEGDLTITFAGDRAALAVPALSVAASTLVDVTNPISVAETTPGGVGTNEVQTLTIGGTPTTGTFKLGFGAETTAAITWSAVNNTLRDRVDAALEALDGIGAGEVTTAVGTMTGGIGTLTITFSGTLAETDVDLITVEDNSLVDETQPTLAIVETTPGVTADLRGAATGAVCHDTTNGVLYINEGTPTAPAWVVVGTQS